MNNSSKSKLFLILALHRSGQCSSWSIRFVGSRYGDNLLPATPANPKGFLKTLMLYY